MFLQCGLFYPQLAPIFFKFSPSAGALFLNQKSYDRHRKKLLYKEAVQNKQVRNTVRPVMAQFFFPLQKQRLPQQPKESPNFGH